MPLSAVEEDHHGKSEYYIDDEIRAVTGPEVETMRELEWAREGDNLCSLTEDLRRIGTRTPTIASLPRTDQCAFDANEDYVDDEEQGAHGGDVEVVLLRSSPANIIGIPGQGHSGGLRDIPGQRERFEYAKFVGRRAIASNCLMVWKEL